MEFKVGQRVMVSAGEAHPRLNGVEGMFVQRGMAVDVVLVDKTSFFVKKEWLSPIEDRFSLPTDAIDPRFKNVGYVKARMQIEQSMEEGRRVVDENGYRIENIGRCDVARDLVTVKVDSTDALAICRKAIDDFVAADAALLSATDALLRYAQGLTDRDPERDRLCRALAPLLRERMGRKLG
jgi:hypothetical protein